MVHDRRRGSYGSDIRQDQQTGLTPVCQTLLGDTQEELDSMDVDSLTEAFTEDVRDTDDFYQRIVSLDEEDFGEMDDGSVEDLEMNTWADWCSSAFGTAFGAFPPEVADTRQAVMFSNRLFSEEELANTVVSVRRDVPMSPVQRLMDVGVAVIPPEADRPVQRTVNRSVGWDDRKNKVPILSWQVCDPPIRIYITNEALTHYMRGCLLYPVGAGDLKGGSVDSRRLDHWRTVVWDPCIVDSRALSVCYDCLCLMALFLAVMTLVRHWAEWSVWTGTDAGHCRTIAWEKRYLPRLHPPCVVDRLFGYRTKIKIPGFVLMLDRDRTISPLAVCLYTRDFAGCPFRGRDSAHNDWLLRLWGWFDRLL